MSQQATQPEESETLIGRIMDHEATPQDLERFEQLAGDESQLWRRLALDQLDMGLLAGRVRQETASAERVDVTPPAGRRQLAFVFSGWAAMLMLAAWWAIAAGVGDRQSLRPAPRFDPATSGLQADLKPEEHLARYLASDFVEGEFDLVVLETKPLGTDRHRVWYMRRIEEFFDIDTPLDAVIDPQGKLKHDPVDIRQ